MTNLATGATAHFPCSQWLAKNEGDHKIVRLLDAETATTAPPPGVATGVAMVQVRL